ncbi:MULTISPECIES: hypothetical protein [Xanthomonas]|uniref:Uncharacterized protein n=1 Tax=Xanthomonas dyei TaxID=743699 RepID=A0ABZ0DFF8_9XANT|nr:hypothetical protein [Xanthomonas dyei]MCC4632074.1 hypothetical protein [Xanthomonas dyei pv. eucalypti]WOB26854.1 hypothetical protein NYR99_02270 [Xanthomonas dyei]WOB54473.1 hypothetical protein NYR95_02270 [Xanthomonas dyei]
MALFETGAIVAQLAQRHPGLLSHDDNVVVIAWMLDPTWVRQSDQNVGISTVIVAASATVWTGRRRHGRRQAHFIATQNAIFRYGIIISQLMHRRSRA